MEVEDGVVGVREVMGEVGTGKVEPRATLGLRASNLTGLFQWHQFFRQLTQFCSLQCISGYLLQQSVLFFAIQNSFS